MKLVVFLPAINEEKTIGKVLDLIPKRIKGINEIVKLVIDDGSTDKTPFIARKKGAIVLSNKSQKHVSFVFQRAVAKSLELKADIAVNIDADMQFDPREIKDLVMPIVNGEADFVAADRFTDKKTDQRRKPPGMTLGKYLANRLGSYIIGVLSGKSFRDVTCGFRAYSRKALLALNLNSKYTYTQESFQVMAAKKFDIKSVPVSIKYFKNRKSRVVTSFFSFLFGSAINILKAFRDFAPLTFFGVFGSLFFFPGFVSLLFVSIHWLMVGTFTPYKFIGLAGIYFSTLGIIIWVVGLLADMLDRVLNNQEKILELQKQGIYFGTKIEDGSENRNKNRVKNRRK